MRALIASLALAGVAASAAGQQQFFAPKSDPLVGDGRVSSFYHWRAPIPARPGTLLRSEPLPPALGLTAAAVQRRILYSSTDGVAGRAPVVVSGAIFLPPGKAPADGWPLIGWAHGTVGIADICAPSWAGRSLRDTNYLNAWLQAGFAVVATDYQGLGVPGPHPYLYTRPGAYALLDSIRASLTTGADLSRDVILVGQSQGGTTVVATGGYASAYAPELRLRGIVATGAGSDRVPPGTLPRPDPEAVTPLMGYAPLAVLTAQITRPDLQPEQVLKLRALGLVDQARRACFPSLVSDAVAAGLSISNALQPTAFATLGAINNPRMGYPTYKLTAPLFIGSGELDKDVPLAMHAALAREACAAGTTVEWHVYKGVDHGGAVNRSLADSLPFVRRLLSNQAIKSRCTAQPQ